MVKQTCDSSQFQPIGKTMRKNENTEYKQTPEKIKNITLWFYWVPKNFMEVYILPSK